MSDEVILEVGDPETFKLRILREKCATCIMRPAGERIELRPGALKELIDDARASESYVVCHSTIYLDDVHPAICRGFADAYSTNALRMAERMLGFMEVDAS